MERVTVQEPDEQRVVDLFDDDLPILPDQTGDDTDLGWGDHRDSGNLQRLLEERPPHWD